MLHISHLPSSSSSPLFFSSVAFQTYDGTQYYVYSKPTQHSCLCARALFVNITWYVAAAAADLSDGLHCALKTLAFAREYARVCVFGRIHGFDARSIHMA